MMKKTDVIVIGSGFAGLISAITAAKNGKEVLLMSYGAGTLTIGGGIIDVLGYGDNGNPLAAPDAGLDLVDGAHPYKKVGSLAIAEAIAFFKQIAEEQGYPYVGTLNKMQWIPTATGTLKPTCLVPATMDPSSIAEAQDIMVVGFDYLKDFYPQLVAKNLDKILNLPNKISTAIVKLPFSEGRDVTNLDVARWLDNEEGRKEFIKQLKRAVKPGITIILPPVLGTMPDYTVLESLEKELKCSFVEAAGMPPSITGLRLQKMLISYAKKIGVTIIEKAAINRAIIENGKCIAVETKGLDRVRTYSAESYILATGGFYGGGLIAEPGRVVEPIFNLPVEAPDQQEKWSNEVLFSNQKQPFAQIGINVNSSMQPLNKEGEVVLKNVAVAGRNLSGYDYCFEKSGNGVALASAYCAAMSL
ncbi:anaerobic glycerol-3-phosphate dehydrogenase subunit GlpB [Dendrosporobacter sp. 1207_IL3150]|uniref:anaerobic glycerol-3-phosphate dehydrogenase subunit GlpB n=1 Tax=Dendrosporobacter sp. 1207_IL3150 TaxID=3084054 RepID=UPI002FDB937C